MGRENPPMNTQSKRPTYTTEAIKSDADQAVLMGHPTLDNLITAMISVSAQMWTQNRRAKITEALLDRHGKVTTAMIEAYVPSAEEEAQWANERDHFIERTFGAFAVTGGPIKPFAQS